ncbi:MAB_1171c family putative transporter [Streptomyces sp. NPDC047315]|uniref:MAB_1171c family putative transporter n=1 Tax=Streptomyces sp. NPDC047315 TaxID=3155142 RepID=UPI003400CA8C
MATDLTMLVPGALLFGAFLLKLPALHRNRGDALLRCVCVLLLLASLVFLLGMVSVIAAINRVVGVPNAAAPLVYAVLSAFSGACVILVIIWRGGVTERTRRATSACSVAYGAVCVALLVLFALGDASEERLRDLDTHYANTPFIREMIVLYLLAHTTAAVLTTVLCWRWSRRVSGVLRVGLVLIVVGYVLNTGYDAAKFTAVGARWAGRDLDYLSTQVAPPFAAASALLISVGFVLPLVTERAVIEWRTAVRHRRLKPLADLLAGAGAAGAARVTIGPLAALQLRLTQREAAIHDGLITLRPFFDARVHEQVFARARAADYTPDRARAAADAAMIAAARKSHDDETVRDTRPDRTAVDRDGPRDGGAPPVLPSTGADDLVRTSLVLDRCPLVREALVHEAGRRRAAMSESGNP